MSHTKSDTGKRVTESVNLAHANKLSQSIAFHNVDSLNFPQIAFFATKAKLPFLNYLKVVSATFLLVCF